MQELSVTPNRRILVIDDNEAIHEDFRKILSVESSDSALDASRAALFGEETSETDEIAFEVDSACQGEEGLQKVLQALHEGKPYAMAFVDVRMPPGWDGIETIGHLWRADPDLLVVICTAYNDYNWTEMSQQLGRMDRWLILRKPFDNVEARQLAASLSEKWDLARKAELKLDELQRMSEAMGRRLTAFGDAVDATGIVAVTDLDGTILEVNENFCRVSGYTRDELLGKNHRIMSSGTHSQEFFSEMYDTICHGGIWRGEVCNQSKDGALYWVDMAIVPQYGEHGNVNSYLALCIEITESKRMMNRLQDLAFTDTLTRLPNRSSILRSIQNMIDRNDDEHFALLFLDFDGFKLINDSLGHDVGDELLRKIADRLRDALRDAERIEPARLGGDEFVVMLSGLHGPEDAIAVAKRLLDVFAQCYKLGSHTVYSTASIGVVTSEHRYESASEMLRDADIAMYDAKSAGRGCYAVFDETLREKAQTRLRTENELHDASMRDEFALFYQPIVSLESGEMVGAEALIRWIHPERGLIVPFDFVSIAEETGMIVPIGKWALDEACRQFAEWQHSLGSAAPPCIHVNVSRQQLLLPNLVAVVTEALTRNAMPPQCLHLEVTETTIIHDRKTAIATLHALRKVGVKIDMDDFGTGYSSLSCLHEFPIDVLKIDRSFLANAEHARDFSARLHAVLTLAENIGLSVVAEGIEDAAQLTLLQALGCTYGQGYIFSEPMSASDFEIYACAEDTQFLKRFEALSRTVPTAGPTDETSRIPYREIPPCEIES